MFDRLSHSYRRFAPYYLNAALYRERPFESAITANPSCQQKAAYRVQAKSGLLLPGIRLIAVTELVTRILDLGRAPCDRGIVLAGACPGQHDVDQAIVVGSNDADVF